MKKDADLRRDYVDEAAPVVQIQGGGGGSGGSNADTVDTYHAADLMCWVNTTAPPRIFVGRMWLDTTP